MKRFTHDADLRGMVVLRSLGFQLVPFKLHRFRKQRPGEPVRRVTHDGAQGSGHADRMGAGGAAPRQRHLCDQEGCPA
nr:hypothetical protein [Aeromonas salmonicida]